MAKPNTLRALVGTQTFYAWLSAQLKLHGSLSEVAAQNNISRAAIYKMIGNEGLVIVQRVMKAPQLDKQEA